MSVDGSSVQRSEWTRGTHQRLPGLVGQLSAKGDQATHFRAFHPHLRPLGEQKPRPHTCHAKFVFTLLGP